MTGWSGLFVQGNITANKEICCVCLCPCASVYVSMPTLFTHVNTQKPHGRRLRAAAAVEYVIQMVCDCLCVCVCIAALICVCALALSSLLVRINGTDVSLRGAYRESLTSLHLL